MEGSTTGAKNGPDSRTIARAYQRPPWVATRRSSG